MVVRHDHIARLIVNANHGIMRAAGMLGVADCVADGVRLAIAKPTERQHIGNQVFCAVGLRKRMLSVSCVWLLRVVHDSERDRTRQQ